MAEQGLTLRWSPIYQSAWDDQPDAYVTAGLVGWERSRRLVRGDDVAQAFRAYIGVHHSDPSRWGRGGEAQARFFLSLFVQGHTIALRTYATFPAAMTALMDFHQQL